MLTKPFLFYSAPDFDIIEDEDYNSDEEKEDEGSNKHQHPYGKHTESTTTTTTTEAPVDIVEFECSASWNGTHKRREEFKVLYLRSAKMLNSAESIL